MGYGSQYITDDQYEQLLEALNVDFSGDDDRKQELLDRAVGDMEADLCERFIVPLVHESGGDYKLAPAYARNKVLNTLKCKIRQLLGQDNARNVVVESTQRFIDVHEKPYTKSIETLLEAKKMFRFKLQEQAEGAVVPVQTVGLARADNDLRVVTDEDLLQ